jgi:hypothetical protein
MGDTLTVADRIDGGDGVDAVSLNGDYFAGVIFTATTMVNVESLQIGGTHRVNRTRRSDDRGGCDADDQRYNPLRQLHARRPSRAPRHADDVRLVRGRRRCASVSYGWSEEKLT